MAPAGARDGHNIDQPIDKRVERRRMGGHRLGQLALATAFEAPAPGYGHTFGKTHDAADPSQYVEPEPKGAGIEMQGLVWADSHGSGNGDDTITNGIEVIWTQTQTQTRWSNNFFKNLFEHEWELTKSPAGAHQWVAKDAPDRLLFGSSQLPGGVIVAHTQGVADHGWTPYTIAAFGLW